MQQQAVAPAHEPTCLEEECAAFAALAFAALAFAALACAALPCAGLALTVAAAAPEADGRSGRVAPAAVALAARVVDKNHPHHHSLDDIGEPTTCRHSQKHLHYPPPQQKQRLSQHKKHAVGVAVAAVAAVVAAAGGGVDILGSSRDPRQMDMLGEHVARERRMAETSRWSRCCSHSHCRWQFEPFACMEAWDCQQRQRPWRLPLQMRPQQLLQWESTQAQGYCAFEVLARQPKATKHRQTMQCLKRWGVIEPECVNYNKVFHHKQNIPQFPR